MEYPVMRLRDYSSFFKPEELDAMTAAYDAAWQHLRINGPSLTAEQVHVLKKNLAQIILASACNGKRDCRAAKGDCIARSVRATAPSTRSAGFAASALRPFCRVVGPR